MDEMTTNDPLEQEENERIEEIAKRYDDSKNPYRRFFGLGSIGTGGLFRAGTLRAGSVSSRLRGLAGAFRRAQWSRHTRRRITKNLSEDDITYFHSLIAEELRKLPKHVEGLNRIQRRELTHAAYRAMKSGKISHADLDDFRQIVEALSEEDIQKIRTHEMELRHAAEHPSSEPEQIEQGVVKHSAQQKNFQKRRRVANPAVDETGRLTGLPTNDGRVRRTTLPVEAGRIVPPKPTTPTEETPSTPTEPPAMDIG